MPDADADRSNSHTPREDTHSGSPEHPANSAAPTDPDQPDQFNDNLTSEVSLEEFFEEGETLPGQPSGDDPDAPENTREDPDGYEEEEYLHLDIDFDDDPYELPADIDMTTPMGRPAGDAMGNSDEGSDQTSGPTMPKTKHTEFDLDNIEEFAKDDPGDSQT